jgi:hypothetical protein
MKQVVAMAMTREPFVIGAISFIAVAGGAGCARSSSNCPGLTAPTGPTYTISGVITAYRGGPVSGATVWAYPVYASPFEGTCNGTPSTQTDQQGHYSWSSLGSGTVSLAVGKEGYQTAYKNNLSAQDSTANFILNPSVTLDPNGGIVAGSIAGDELTAGDDVLFGGLCARTACKIVGFALPGFQSPAVKLVEVRLRWNDPARQLALYVSHVGNLEDPPWTYGTTAERHCCSAELVGTADLGKYFPDVVAVAFEQAAGGPPGPSDSQAFELTVRPIP